MRRGGLAVVALALACGGGSGLTEPAPRATAPALAPQSMEAMSVTELRLRLQAFADLAMREMAGATDRVRDSDPDPGARAFARAIQASVAATSLGLSVEPDPEAALPDLMASIASQRAYVEDAGARLLSPDASAALIAALRSLEDEIWALGALSYPPAQLSALRARLDSWSKAKPSGAPGGIVRVADLPAEGPALSKGLFTPIAEATRQVEETRLLGERFLFLAERLPTVTLWHTEALTWGLLASPEARQALGDVTDLTGTLSDLSTAVDSLPATMTDQREALLAALDAREATMHGLLSDAGVVVSEARSLTEAGERLVGLSDDAAERLSSVIDAADELLAALRDPDAPGGPVSLDVESYAGALADFRAAAEALDGALRGAEGVQDAPRAWIDHAFWRAVQLMLLAFALAVVYRAAPRLLRGKST